MAFMKSLYHRMLDSRIDGSRIDVDLGNGDGRHKYQLTSYRDELYILHRFYQAAYSRRCYSIVVGDQDLLLSHWR